MFILQINVKMPTIVGILTFMSKINFVLSCVEYEKKFYNLLGQFSVNSICQCWLLKAFRNSLDPDKAGQNGSKLFDKLMVCLKKCFKSFNFEEEKSELSGLI